MYEFKEQDAYDFARHVGVRAVPKNEELFFKTCPYCKPSSRERTNLNSFSINLRTGQFKCLRDSCGVSGNMITLAKDFNFSLGTDIDEYYRPTKQYRKLKKPEKPIIPKPEAIQYLEKRGISADIAAKYQITVRTDKPNILVFQFFDENGELQFIKYRKTDFDKEKDKNKEWCEANCKPILFGMMQCNKQFDKLIITEGQIDSLSVAMAGYENVVSVPTGSRGFTWVPYCWNWISKFKEVIVFGDYEKEHISLLDELKTRLSCEIRHVSEEDYKDCKDANELLIKYGVAQVRHCIENAVQLPVEKVVSLADVKDMDLFKIPKLKTGVRQLDILLYGGLPFGYVHILGGKRGDGKSTWASGIIKQAIEQGYTSFIYSGELTNSNFKAWLDFQIAGPKNIVETTNLDGSPHWFITKSNKELINEWYKDKCYIYDNSMVDDEDEGLLKTIVEVICKYGVKIILVDNLMTAIDLDADPGTDRYEKQSRFVKKLTKIALRYEAMILLVAHRRKNNYTTDANDEISGSADITNLAGIVMSYDRDNEFDNPSDRKLIVAKNRLFGKLNLDGIRLHFHEKSKRIFASGDDVFAECGWNADKSGFVPLNSETPFG